MSYNVVVCRSPVPEDNAEVWQQMDDLIQQEGPVPPVFETFIDRLTARYPCMCDLPDDEVDDGVWSDGPLRDNAGHRVTVLGISNRLDEVLPFVIATANDLG